MLRKLRDQTKSAGQAIVEFALAATLIFFLLAAAVDLGLIFFTLQGLNNAAQEGARFGAKWLITDPDTGARSLQFDEIRNRVRFESGTGGGVNYVNLMDLNNNGVVDVANTAGDPLRLGTNDPDMQLDGSVVNSHIQVTLVRQDRDTLEFIDDPDCLVQYEGNPAVTRDFCFVRVTVSYDYDLVFGLAPSFGDRVNLSQSHLERIIDPFTQGGAGQAAQMQTFTPQPSMTPIPTSTATSTHTPGPSPTQTDTSEPTSTHTPGPSPTNTNTPDSSPTNTGTATADPSVSPTATQTINPSASPSMTPTETETPTFTPTPSLYIVWVDPPADGQVVETRDDTKFRVIAYDRSVVPDDKKGDDEASDGLGINRVEFEIRNPEGEAVYSRIGVGDNDAKYCVFGDDGNTACDRVGDDTKLVPNIENVITGPGTYTMRARAIPSSGGAGTPWIARTFVVPEEESIEIAIYDDEEDDFWDDGKVIDQGEEEIDSRIRAIAYDTDVGTNDGDGIRKVQFEIRSPLGSLFKGETDEDKRYCMFGGGSPCDGMDSVLQGRLVNGTYTVRARALGDFLWSDWVETTFVIEPMDLFIGFTNPISGTIIDPDEVNAIEETRFRVIAYDPEKVAGAPDASADISQHVPHDGIGIGQVQMEIFTPDDRRFINGVTDTGTKYCPLGGGASGKDCDKMNADEWFIFDQNPGTYIIRARARTGTTGRWSNYVFTTFIRPQLATPTPTSTHTPGPSPTPTTTPTITPTPLPCDPAGDTLYADWQTEDVGANAISPGSTNFNGSSVALCGSGDGIDKNDSTDNGFRYAYKSVSGFTELRGQITVWDSGLNANAMLGLMVRESTNPNSKYYMVGLNRDYEARALYRTGTGSNSGATDGDRVQFRRQMDFRIVREGNTFTSYLLQSVAFPDGSTKDEWVKVHSKDITMSSDVLVGVAITSDRDGPDEYVKGRVEGLTVDGNSILPTHTPGPSPTPTETPIMTPTPRNCEPGTNSVSGPWSSGDIGSPAVGSTVQESADTFFICGSGTDIWGGSDSFRYVYQNVDDSFSEIVIRVSHHDGSVHSWSKVGPMIRSSTATDAANLMVRLTGSNGISTQWRESDGNGWSSSSGGQNYDVPIYLRLTKSGKTITGYYSYDGSSWTKLNEQNINDLGSNFLVGIAVLSHDDGKYAQIRAEVVKFE